MGLYQTLFKSFPLISILLVGGATLAFWWAYYKDRKKLLAVNYLSDLLGRKNKKKRVISNDLYQFFLLAFIWEIP
nr:hypothetical protein [Bacillus subtilis]